MRILMTPMSTVAETGGSMTRTRAIAQKAKNNGHEVAFCAGEDCNYRGIEGIMNHPSPIPSPLGLPKCLGDKLFPIIKRIGIQEKISIKNFEQVLKLIGAIEYDYFKRDIESVRLAIKKFQPDIVFTEHRISPIVAAKLENIESITIYSAPIDRSRHGDDCGKFSNPIIKIIKEYSLPPILSVLDIYDWASEKIIPSSPELEPIDCKGIKYVGTLIKNARNDINKPGKNIIAYMGNGTISAKKLYKTLYTAFFNTEYEVYIATKEMRPIENRNIHVNKRFDFNLLMKNAVSLISHGGQNSMMQSLLNGIPLIVCPGKIFERQFNAESIVRLGAGVLLSEKKFHAAEIGQMIEKMNTIQSYKKNAEHAGRDLMNLGGVNKALEIIEAHK